MIKELIESPIAQRKGCPKGAFLGLCEKGKIQGIARGSYTKSVKNKAYALEAVQILTESNKSLYSPRELWKTVMKGEVKSYNSQMEVVLALWERKK